VDLAEELPLALPEEVQIEPTGPGKYGPGKSPAFLCYDTFCRLVDQFAGARVLRLQGAGEPLAHPRIFDMVRFAAARGMQVSVLTSLPPLPPRRADECATSGLQYLDVVTPTSGGAALLWPTLGRLQKARKVLGGVLPWIRLVVPASRMNEVGAALRVARERGLDGVSIQHLPGSLRAKHAPLQAELEQAAALADELGVRLDIPEHHGSCDAPSRSAYINFYGRARPCAMVNAADRLSFGNMSRDGVVRVWNSEEYRDFRARLASDQPPAVCAGCAVYSAR
jgi:MoaA/NifB/PqqE/SkfB family radical SAM enzyme